MGGEGVESVLRMCFPLGRPSSPFCFITPALCGGFALACYRLEGPPLQMIRSSELNGETSLPPEQQHIHSPSISRQRSVTQAVRWTRLFLIPLLFLQAPLSAFSRLW